MKFSLLAAVALIAAPAMAQMSGGQPPAAGQTMGDPAQTQTPDQTMPPADPAADPAAQPPAAPPAGDPAMTQQPGASMPAQTTGDPAMAQPSATGGSPASTAGGYAPANAGTMAPAPAGTQVQFRPQPTPDQAFPPPPAKESYPICKAGQYDGCMQASGGRKARRR